MDAREWEAEVRDNLYPCASSRGLFLNADRLSGGGRAQGAMFSSVGEKGRTILMKAGTGLSMKEFRNLLNIGSELKLRSDTETHLRAHLAAVRKIFRDIERLLPSDVNEGQMVITAAEGAAVPQVKHSSQSLALEGQGQLRGLSTAAGHVHGRTPSFLLHSSPGKKGGVSSTVPRVSEEDDEEDEDENPNGCKGKGKGKGGVRCKPHIGVISELLLALDRLPPGLLAARDSQGCTDIFSPSIAIRELYTLSLSLKEHTEMILDRASVSKILKPK